MTLLFSGDFQVLGEFFFEQGKLKQFSLSHEGERQLGALVAHWQTSGIALKERFSQTEDKTTTYTIARRSILVSHADAEAAFLCWAADDGFIALALPERLLPYWQKLCSLDLQPEERFASLQALRHAPHRLVEAWDQALDRMIKEGSLKK